MPPASLSADETRRLRVIAQGLAGGDRAASGADAVADIVRRTGGIQAQDMQAAAYQVRARSVGLTAADMYRAQSEERSVVRTWAMRGTLHMIPSEDQRWVTSLLGPSAFSAGRGRRLQLGLDEATLAKAHELAIEALTAEGPLTRQQLGERLAPHGIPVADQGLHHVVRSGGFLGIITHGPMLDEGRTETFVAADSWLSGIKRPELSRDEALARLTSRYIRAFGPSTPQDFAAWSGLPLRDARAGWQAIQDELVEVEAAGEMAWEPRAPHPNPLPGGEGIVQLLGFFDTYLLGYKGRGLAVAEEHLSRVNAGGGMIRSVVIIDGLAVATWSWKWRSGGRALEIAIEPFEGMEDRLGTARAAIEGEVRDIGRFLSVESSLAE